MTDLGPLAELFHRLNNHLGIVLVNAELIEARCPDAGTRTRAADVFYVISGRTMTSSLVGIAYFPFFLVVGLGASLS